MSEHSLNLARPSFTYIVFVYYVIVIKKQSLKKKMKLPFVSQMLFFHRNIKLYAMGPFFLSREKFFSTLYTMYLLKIKPLSNNNNSLSILTCIHTYLNSLHTINNKKNFFYTFKTHHKSFKYIYIYICVCIHNCFSIYILEFLLFFLFTYAAV